MGRRHRPAIGTEDQLLERCRGLGAGKDGGGGDIEEALEDRPHGGGFRCGRWVGVR